MAVDLGNEPALGSNWLTYGGKLFAAVKELQATVASLSGSGGTGGLTLAGAVSSLTVQKRPVLMTGLVAGADNTAALNNAFAAAQPYDTLVIPTGEWTHSGALYVQAANPNVRIEGQGRMAKLVGTNARYGGLICRANGTSLIGINHTVVGATSRGNGENFDDCPFAFDNCTDIVLEDLVSAGSRDAAFFVSTVRRMRARDLVMKDSFADGFHVSNGSKDITVAGIDGTNIGDDGVAVVSYTGDADVVERVKVTRVTITNGLARGISVVGGRNVEYHDVDLFRTRGAGVYVAHEQGDFNTRAVENVDISAVRARETNWDPSLDSGAFGLFNLVSGTTMKNVRIAGLHATGMRKQSNGMTYGLVKNAGGGGGKFAGVVLQDITLDKGTAANAAIYIDNSINATTVVKDGETYNSATGSGVYQNDEGYKIYGNTALGTAGSTAVAPDIDVKRVRVV